MQTANAVDRLLVRKIAAPDTALVRVIRSGVLLPEDRHALVRIKELLSSRFLFGLLDTGALIPAPDGEGWIESLPAGSFRDAARKLRALAAQG